MATASMTRILDNARINLPGALDNAILMELFSLLNEFFQDTNIWKENIDFDVKSSTMSYIDNPGLYTFDLVPAEYGSIVRLLSTQTSQGRPVAAIMPEVPTLILKSLPAQDDTYTATVSKTVSDPVSKDGIPECPDWVINKYNNDLTDGLIGRMQAQTAKPYSSPTMAMMRLKRFEAAKFQAKTEAERQALFRAQTWRFPGSFASRKRTSF